MGVEISPPAHTDRKLYPRLHRSAGAAQRMSRRQEGAFFFTKKAYLRESDSLRGRRKEVCTDPPLFPPFKNYGVQGDLIPLAELEAEPRGLFPEIQNLYS